MRVKSFFSPTPTTICNLIKDTEFEHIMKIKCNDS